MIGQPNPFEELERRRIAEAKKTLQENPELLEELGKETQIPPPPIAPAAAETLLEATAEGARAMSKKVSADLWNEKLHAEIRDVALDKEFMSFDKRRTIADLVEAGLKEQGGFLRTSDGRTFFFHNRERRLYDLEQTSFQYLLTTVSGLSSTENFFKFTRDVLEAKVSREAPLVEVHSFAHFDTESGLLAASNGAGGIWLRERGGNWYEGRNGDNGLLFLTEPEAIPWVPEFGANGHSQEWFFSQFLFSKVRLSVEDARTVLDVWLSQQFFPSLRQTRVIPCFLGPQGSGKTTGERLVGRLLLGPGFEITGVQRDKEDGFVAAVTNRVVLGLDNADSRIPWLPDALALYATNQRYRMRRLYRTNEEVSYAPRSILMISSRDPQFNRADVTERLLPLHCERPDAYRTGREIYSELCDRRGAIMGSLLVRVGEIADILYRYPAKPLAFRMADFGSFGERVFASLGKSSEWIELLVRLEHAQAEFATENDGLVIALAEVLKQGPVLEMPISDLFRRCSAVAETQGLLLPRTTQAFGKRLTNMRRVIELELGLRYQEMRVHAGGRLVSLISKRGGDGGDGDNISEKDSG